MELPPLSKELFIQAMRGPVAQVLGEVADAVRAAPTGRVITCGGEKVRDLMAATAAIRTFCIHHKPVHIADRLPGSQNEVRPAGPRAS